MFRSRDIGGRSDSVHCVIGLLASFGYRPAPLKMLTGVRKARCALRERKKRSDWTFV